MIDFSETLFVIPARGGSKGLPGKNIKPLTGKPLIHYSIEYARQFATDENICLTTESEEIIEAANLIGLKVPFIRPENLASDHTSTFEVMHHVIDYYSSINSKYKYIVLLQPTSPFREKFHLEEAFKLMEKNTEVIVSVTNSNFNPYYNLFEENSEGNLAISKGTGKFTRRQDCPAVYAFNGSIYIFEIDKLRNCNSFNDFENIKKYVMDPKFSLDIDTEKDWLLAEYIFSNIK